MQSAKVLKSQREVGDGVLDSLCKPEQEPTGWFTRRMP